MHKKKLLDLLAKKQAVLDRMVAADDAGDQAAFDAAQQEMTALDAQIARVQAIVDAEEAGGMPPQGAPQGAAGEPGAPQAAGGQPVNSAECIHAFCECIRAQISRDHQRFVQNADVVRRAVRNESAGMNEGTASEGGLIVPQDVQTQINSLRRALNPLSDLFAVENVSFLSGSRVVDTHPTAGFTKVSEFGTIPRDDKPAFSKIEYKVEDYALIVPVSNDLLQDTDQALLSYLSGWFAKKGVLTENKLLLGLLSALNASAATAASGSELATIKGRLNVTLDPAIALSSRFVTNQDGFNYLDTLVDKDGRPLLQPNPTDATVKMLLGRSVTVMPNSILPTTATKAPLYFGDFTQYGTLFRRKALELAATDIGGNAWVTNSTEVRGIMRLDAKTFDAAAATAVLLTISA